MDTIVLAVILLIAVYTDLRFNKIFNGLCLFALVSGLALHIAAFPLPTALLLSLGGMLGAFVIFIPFYALGGMAAGDVKLISGCAAILGWPNSMLAVGYTLMFGTVLGIVYYCARAGLSDLVARYGSMAMMFLKTGGIFLPDGGVDSAAKSRIPYAVAIAAGCGVAQWMKIS